MLVELSTSAGIRAGIGAALCGYALVLWPAAVLAEQQSCNENVSAQLRLDSGHPWRPPFGVDRVGAPLAVRAEVKAAGVPLREYHVVAYQDGRELERQPLTMGLNPAVRLEAAPISVAPLFGNTALTSNPTEVVLVVRCAGHGTFQEVTRQSVTRPELEAEAVARADLVINPVDLGTILVPHDWLLLASGQKAVIEFAAISRTRDLPNARLRARFAGGTFSETAIPLARHGRATGKITLPLNSRGDRAVLQVSLTDGTRELWKKDIHTMIVAQPQRWPNFGAVETKLRYDPPISVKDPHTGTASAISYDTAWGPQLNDVVVFLPNGSRFVFWRGSNYVPFWASRHNTGLSYQWAENLSQPIHRADGTFEGFPEPLNDKELRYSRVRILESTPSRVHVRWTYQSTDRQYRIWGDQAAEDYYFYPDGFGTRVLTVTGAPNAKYELTEFISITPQAAFPLEVIPSPTIDVLSLDGGKRRLTFPFQQEGTDADWKPHIELTDLRSVSSLYRVLDHKDDPTGVIYFAPRDPPPSHAYAPIYQHRQIITPAFWGSHWPLGRSDWIGWGAVDDRVHATPAHNSLLTWLTNQPKPLSTSAFAMPDTLGKSRDMTIQRWAWLIAKTVASDDELLAWAQSFSSPPSVEVTGARMDSPSYSPERRAIRLLVESSSIDITLKPVMRTVNPVFELDQAPRELRAVTLDGKDLSADSYAWDGATLWMSASIDAREATIRLRFRDTGK